LTKEKWLYVAMVIAALGIYLFDASQMRGVKLVLLIGLVAALSLPRNKVHRILASLVVVAVAGVLSWQVLVQFAVQWLRSTASEEPLWSVVAPKQQVTLGGQRLYYDLNSQALLGTVGFSPAEGVLVVMAHAAEPLAVDQQVGVVISADGSSISCQAQVLANEEAGIVMGLPEGALLEGELIPVGGTADIQVGAEALVYTDYRDAFAVMVDGFVELHEHQMIVLTPGNPANKIIAGMSGSPVVQNGKLIGMLAMRVQAPQQTENYGLARLAADIYVSTEGYFDWDPAGSGLIAYDPDRHWLEELTDAAHEALAEHYQLDLTRFHPVESWDQRPSFSYTPAFTGKEVIQLCIQDAQQEHGQGATIPPLVLLNQRKCSNRAWMQKWGLSPFLH
jgi:hypothetical protein